MRILVAGASGLIGSALLRELTAAGHSVVRLVRGPAGGADEAEWHPERGEFDAALLDGVDAVVCLNGAGVGSRRWTESYKKTLRESRLQPVGTLARAIASHGGPAVYVTASAVGYYGDTGDRVVDEAAGPGSGFLAELCVEWESAAAPAQQAGIRQAALRTGLVLGPGGLLGRLKPILLTGLGGPLGDGLQYQPWISLRDEVAAIRYVLEHDDLSGPVNLTGPDPVPNRELMKALASALHRPAVVPAPAFALRLVLGEFADDGVLKGQRAVPAALLRAGFEFRDPTLEQAARWALSDQARA